MSKLDLVQDDELEGPDADGGEDFDQAGLPSTKPGDLGDFEQFAISSGSETRSASAVICSVGRPGKIDFFRVPADDKLYRDFSVLEFEADGGNKKQYLVGPGLSGLPELEGRAKTKRLVPYVTLHGALGLWPISLDQEDNTWVRSALYIVGEARSRWVAAISHRQSGAYRMLPASGLHPEPVWPLKNLKEWLDLSFPPERRILDRNHPVMMKLRGE
jgi:hypothetical protein